MNININISGASDSQSIQLLTNVINCLQSEIEKFATLESEKNDLATKFAVLESEKNDLATKFAVLESEKNGLATKFATLEGEKNDLVTKFAVLEGEKNGLATKFAVLESEKNDLATKFAVLESEKNDLATKFAVLEGEKNDLVTKFAALESEKNDLATKFATLEGEKNDLTIKCNTLESEKQSSDNKILVFTQERTDRFIASIKHISMMLHSSLKSELNSEWAEYIGRIKNDIDVFLSEVKSINDITLKIVSKNGWFAKLASIYWWSVATNVRESLPISLQEGSGFHYSFCNLLNEMKISGLEVTIPNGNFSNKIDSYKKDYSEDTAVQKLFPEYRPESFVLCEINYVSFNGNLGTCIGYK